MDLAVNGQKLEKMISSYKKENYSHNNAAMHAVKKIMNSPKDVQIKCLGNYALDFHNYQKKFYSEMEKYQKYIDMFSSRENVKNRLESQKSNRRKSNLLRKLVSLRIVDDMGILREEDEKESNLNIYDLAFGEYLENDNLAPKDALRRALSNTLREDPNYAYSILQDSYLEALSLKKKIKENDYTPFFYLGEDFFPDFSLYSEDEKTKFLKEVVQYDLFENGLTLVTEKLLHDSISVDPLVEKITDFFESMGYHKDDDLQ